MNKAQFIKRHESDFYVYVHRRISDGMVFYVGKGKGKRAFNITNRNKYWHRIANKHGVAIEIVESGMQEWWSHELEIDLISYYGRVNLCNGTDGGEGNSGFNVSKETRLKLSALASLRTHTEETKRKISESKKAFHSNTKFSPETLERLRVAGEVSSSDKCVTVECSNGIVFKSIRKAVDWLTQNGHEKAKTSSIRHCRTGRQKTAYGFKWTFK